MYIPVIGIIGSTIAYAVGAMTSEPMLQHGALGILAFVVFWLITKTIPSFLTAMRDQRKDATDALDKIGTQHVQSLERIAETFRREQEDGRKMCDSHFDMLRDDMRKTQEQLVRVVEEAVK